jgi:hypothetical protein
MKPEEITLADVRRLDIKPGEALLVLPPGIALDIIAA